MEDDCIKGFQILLPRFARLLRVDTEPVFLNVYGAPESEGMNSASLCSLHGGPVRPLPPRFLAPIDFLKIPARLSLQFLNF